MRQRLSKLDLWTGLFGLVTILAMGSVLLSFCGSDEARAPGYAPQAVATVCLRDGSCVVAGGTATPALTPDGTRPVEQTATVTPSPTSARETATPTPSGTPCVVSFRDGSSLPCGSTATRVP